MHCRYAAVLLLGSLALGQAASPSSPQSTAKPAAPPAAQPANPATAESSSVAPNTAVITITGVCDAAGTTPKAAPATKPAADCKTVVTRAQFERLANSLQPNMPPAIQRRLADAYPKILLMAHEARKRGLENDPKLKELFQFVKLQVLSQELSRSLKDEADKVPDAEIESYYKANGPNFEQASLQRLFIPKDKQREPAGEEAADKDDSKAAEAQKAAEEAMKKEAEALRTRAAAGEDFDKLQKEAYDTAGLKGSPPTTSLGKLTRNEIPANHRSVVDLPAGQVSPLFTEPNGYYVYKVVAKDTKSLSDAREQIRATLSQQRLQAAMERVQNSGKTELNETYFAPPPPAMRPGAAPAPGGASPTPNKQPETGKKPGDSNQEPPK